MEFQTKDSLTVYWTFLLLLFLSGAASLKDIHLTGLLPYRYYEIFIHDSSLALKHINTNKDVLPGYRLNILWNDTKCDAGTALEVLYYQLYTRPTKVMTLGAICTKVTAITSVVSSRWNVVQISQLSSAPEFSTKPKYSRLFRLMSCEKPFWVIIIKIIKEFGWKRLSVLYQETKSYSKAMVNLYQLLETNRIEITNSEAIVNNNIKTPIYALIKAKARIIIVHVGNNIFSSVLCEIYQANFYGPDIVWLFNGWAMKDPPLSESIVHNCSHEEVEVASKGYFMVNVIVPEDASTVSGYKRSEIIKQIERKRSSVHLSYRLKAYDAVWVAALAINKTINDLLQTGSNKTIEDFDYRDDLMGQLLLNNTYKTDFLGTHARVRFKHGRIRNVKIGIFVRKQNISLLVGWLHSETDENIITWNFKEIEKFIWEDGKIPADNEIRNEMTLSPILYYITCTAVSLADFMTFFFLLFTYIKRKKYRNNVASYHLTFIVLMGGLLIYTSVLLVDLGPVTNVMLCEAQLMVFIIGYSLTVGSLLAMEWRVYRKLKNRDKEIKSDKDTQDIYYIYMVGILLIVNVSIVTLWYTIDPLKVVRQTKELLKSDNDFKQEKTMRLAKKCDSPLSYYFHLLLVAVNASLLLMGTFIAIQTKRLLIDERVNSQIIGLCIYNVLSMSLLGLAVVYLMNENVNVHFCIKSSIIIIGTLITQCLLIVPKIKKHGFARSKLKQNVKTATTSVSLI